MILVVGLSPAWQRTLEFDSIQLGEVNRAKRVSETASGKGVNVARVARQLGARVRLLTVAGGERGKLLACELPWARVVPVKAETRICQTILTGNATELVEEAGPLGREEVSRVLRAFADELRRATLVVLTGTVPGGCGDTFYARLITTAQRRGVRVLVDAQGQLLVNAFKARPFLVRVNRVELAVARRRRGSEWLVVSDGTGRIEVASDEGRWSLKPPRVKVVNPVGSGDAMLAGIACGLHRGRPMIEAIRLGVACGAANALTPLPGFVRSADFEKLLRQVW
jgi:fructose-1-phosphate kinase PfkB-like protein